VTSSWTIEVDVGPDTLYTAWNVEPSQLTGATVLGSMDYNDALVPGEVVSAGFCVTRAAVNGSLPDVIRVGTLFQ
jgi:hypothetical protein